jgi:hypothetical protein
MHVLDLRSPDLRATLQHPVLAKRPILGRGRYSLVFDKGASVIKATIDTGAIALLTRRGRKAVALPRVLHDHGVIGTFKQDAPIRALELEKLRVLRASSHNYRTAAAVCRVFKRHSDAEWFAGKPADFRYSKVLARARKDLREIRGFTPALMHALESIVSFVEAKNLDVDLHIKNFMERPATGELVISDPVVCRDMAKFL